GAAAVLPLGNDAFEARVLHWMVFDRHRQALLACLVRRALGNRPRFQHALHLEAQVVMQVARVVFLNDEQPPVFGGFFSPPAGRRRRLGRAAETALRWLALEGSVVRRRTRARAVLEVQKRLRQLLLDFEDGRERIALFLNPAQTFFGLEKQHARVALFNGPLQFVPRNRQRDERSFLFGAERVDRDCRFPLRVLAPVDEDLLFTFYLRHFRDDEVGMVALERLGDALRERLRGFVRRRRVERHVQVDALRSRYFHERFELQ